MNWRYTVLDSWRQATDPTNVLVCAVYDLVNGDEPDWKGYALDVLMARCRYIWPILWVHELSGVTTPAIAQMDEDWCNGQCASNEMYGDPDLTFEEQWSAIREHELLSDGLYRRYRALDPAPPLPTLTQLLEGARRYCEERRDVAA